MQNLFARLPAVWIGRHAVITVGNATIDIAVPLVSDAVAIQVTVRTMQSVMDTTDGVDPPVVSVAMPS